MTGLPRLLPPPEEKRRNQHLSAHLDRHGGLPYRARTGALISEIAAAGLTGRGGAAFPVYKKLEAVCDAAAKRHRVPKVIANGAESEPASDKDTTLLWLSPHLVLDGLQLAAEAVGADTAILYIHADRGKDVGARLSHAIRERQARGLDRVPVQLAQAPASFLSGQETALLNHLTGGPAIPTFTPPRITERGLGGAPTLVQNVETLAHLALIARQGPRWFRGVGTEAEPGSMLTTVRGCDGRSRISEVPLGIPLKTLFSDLPSDSAVLIGGYHGTWVSGSQALQLTLDNSSLSAAHARVGAGIVIALPPNRCGLAEVARVARYLAMESAGQCGPCLNALPRIATALAEIAAGRAQQRTLNDVERWSALAAGRGACRHPDGAARFVSSALQTFAVEVGRHRKGRCSAASREPFLPVPRSVALASSPRS